MEDNKTTLIIECMWCHKFMGTKDGKGAEGISHSICPGCLKENYPQRTQQTVKFYLEGWKYLSASCGLKIYSRGVEKVGVDRQSGKAIVFFTANSKQTR